MGADMSTMLTRVLLALPAIVEAVRTLSSLFQQKPTQDGVGMAEEAQRTGKSRDQLVTEARQSLWGFDPDKYNFAICGPSGSGKSTMVNVLQGVRDGARGAAKVGETECTDDIQSYPIDGSHLVVWDLPGCGTTRHPFQGYFEDKKLYAFDGLILTYTSRLDENTVDLYQQCVERQVPVMLVRTQADRTFDAKVGRNMSSKDAIAEMHADFAKELKELGLADSSNAFYVSMRDLVKGQPRMDEQGFLETVLRFGRERAPANWNPQARADGLLRATADRAAPAAAAPAAAAPAAAATVRSAAAPMAFAAPPMAGTGELLTVLHDFNATESKFLSIKKGDVVTLVQARSEWSFVEMRGGGSGLVPSTYIRSLFEGTGPAPPPPPPGV